MLVYFPGPELRSQLSIVFLVIGAIDLFMAGLSIYLIFYYSHKNYGYYKWIQLLITLSILYSDVWGVLASAVFIPTGGAIIVSSIDFGFTLSNLFVALLADGIMLQFSAKVLAFYFRIYILLPKWQQEFFKKGHHAVFALMFLCIHVVPVVVFMDTTRGEDTLQERISQFPELALLQDVTDPILLYHIDYPGGEFLRYFLLVLVVLFAPCACYSLFCIYKYLLRSKIISTRTRRLQMRLVCSLVVQCLVPLIICVVPYWTVMISCFESHFYIPYVTQYADLICCTHSTTINAILLIVLTKPFYERFFLRVRALRTSHSTTTIPTRIQKPEQRKPQSPYLVIALQPVRSVSLSSRKHTLAI